MGFTRTFGERAADQFNGFVNARRPCASSASPASVARAASASRPNARKHIERHDVARAFPDRVDRRLAVKPRQHAVLDVAVAAEALHRLVDQRRRGLADPDISPRASAAAHARPPAARNDARSNERQSRITSASAPSTSSAMSASTVRIIGWSASHLPNTLRCRQWCSACAKRRAHHAGRRNGAVEPGELHHRQDGAHACALLADPDAHRHPRTRPPTRHWSGCRACPSGAGNAAR